MHQPWERGREFKKTVIVLYWKPTVCICSFNWSGYRPVTSNILYRIECQNDISTFGFPHICCTVLIYEVLMLFFHFLHFYFMWNICKYLLTKHKLWIFCISEKKKKIRHVNSLNQSIRWRWAILSGRGE